MANTPRRRPNLVAQAAADKAAEAEADLQSAIDSVVIENLGLITGAISTRDALAKQLQDARIAVGSTKLMAWDKLAKSALDGKWTEPQIGKAIEAAMRIWAGNETINGVTPEMLLKSKTAEKLRSELGIPMLPEVRENFVTIVTRAQEAWDAEGAEFAASEFAKVKDGWKLADSPTPLRKAFYNRFAEMALKHLRDARDTVTAKGLVPGVVHADRAAMIVAAAAKPTRQPRTPNGAPEVVHAVPPTSQEAAGVQIAAILAAIDKLGEDWNATELLADAREAFRKVASGPVLAKRKAGVVLAPSGAERDAAADKAKREATAARAAEVKAAADAKATEPVPGAAVLDDAVSEEEIAAELIRMRRQRAAAAAK